MTKCAVTGYRPHRFTFKYDERHPDCVRLKQSILGAVGELYNSGVRRFYAGGALGVDMWTSEIILWLRDQKGFSDLELYIALPFRGHDRTWLESSRQRMNDILRRCDSMTTVCDMHVPESQTYRLRNVYMVDRSDCLLAVCGKINPPHSGTVQTMNYARKQSRPILIVDPETSQYGWTGQMTL